MLKITLIRILQSGWNSFVRNSWLSAASILTMTVALFMIINLVFFNVITQTVLATLKDKVDVSVYFNPSIPEDQILRVQRSLTLLENVKRVDYVSRDEALIKFKEKHKENFVLLKSLEELEDNPLQPSLNIKTYSASQYESVVNFLESGRYKELIDKINYRQNENLISRFSAISKNVQRTVLGIMIILALLAILVTFNTIRLAIYNWRDEIGVMKLVGASNWYVRGPFLVEGILYGASAALISLIIVYPAVYFISPKLINFLPGVNLWQFSIVHLWQMLLLQLSVGVVLGAASSLIAIRRYLKI